MNTEPKKKLYQANECYDLELKDVQDLYRQYVSSSQVDMIGSFGFGKELADTAIGSWITTKSGKRILDFTGGMGVLNHGHNHPRILQVRKEYQEKLKMEVHKNFLSPYIAALSHNIAQLLPGDLNISYFPNSGAEAVEGAMKMAYKYHQQKRKVILHSHISFHGKLFGSASVTGSPEVSFQFPQIPNVDSFIYNDFDSVQQKVEQYRQQNGQSDIYAIILEPFSASSLLNCSEKFLRNLRKLCSDQDIVLIFDEVYTGWAKTGKLFYFMHYPDLYPDILTTSKSFGGGKASIACYVAREPIFRKAYDNLQDVALHSTTFNALGEETITAIEAINILVEDGYVERSKKLHQMLQTGLQQLQSQYPQCISSIRGSGALNSLIFNSGPELMPKLLKLIPGQFFKDERFLKKLVTAAVINNLYEKHQILTNFANNHDISLWVSPCLVADTAEVDFFLNGLKETLSQGMMQLVLQFVKNKLFSK